jgi:hypothetical protein
MNRVCFAIALALIWLISGTTTVAGQSAGWIEASAGSGRPAGRLAELQDGGLLLAIALERRHEPDRCNSGARHEAGLQLAWRPVQRIEALADVRGHVWFTRTSDTEFLFEAAGSSTGDEEATRWLSYFPVTIGIRFAL